MLSTRLPRPIRPIPVPSPNRAVAIGRPIASSEPKLISSTTIAAPIPIRNV